MELINVFRIVLLGFLAVSLLSIWLYYRYIRKCKDCNQRGCQGKHELPPPPDIDKTLRLLNRQ